MKKYLVALILVLSMAGSVFAIGVIDPNTNINTNTNVDTNANTNLNTQGQMQGQGQVQGQKQGQKQNQNNNQAIAPVQETVVTTPQNLLPLPSQEVPSLHFGNGSMADVTREIPLFALYGIRPLGKGERILGILKVDANVKFKNLYQAILEDGMKVSASQGDTMKVRFTVTMFDSQKSWTTGGNIGGGGSGLGAGGLAGGSGAGSIIPQIGRTKADPLYTIIFMKIFKE